MLLSRHYFYLPQGYVHSMFILKLCNTGKGYMPSLTFGRREHSIWNPGKDMISSIYEFYDDFSYCIAALNSLSFSLLKILRLNHFIATVKTVLTKFHIWYGITKWLNKIRTICNHSTFAEETEDKWVGQSLSVNKWQNRVQINLILECKFLTTNFFSHSPTDTNKIWYCWNSLLYFASIVSHSVAHCKNCFHHLIVLELKCRSKDKKESCWKWCAQ